MKVINRELVNVSRLWNNGKIIAWAFNTPQLERDMKRLNLDGEIEETEMRYYLVEMMAKEVVKQNRNK